MPLSGFKLREAEDDHDRKLLSDIERFGWHVVHINEDAEGPSFSFSVGFYYTFQQPEILIMGLKQEVAHDLLKIAYVQMSGGMAFKPFERNSNFAQGYVYDGDALPAALQQTEAITGRRPIRAIVDRGYRGRQQVEGTEVSLPRRPKPGQSKSTSTRMRARFRRRAAIEPLIGHLKHQYRLLRCFLKGHVLDQINLMLAAAAWNFRKWMRGRLSFWLWILSLLKSPYRPVLLPPGLLK